MPTYVYDLNEGDTSDWEDEDLECEGRGEIEEHARRLLDEAGVRQAARGSASLPSTVVVYQENGLVVMSAHGWSGRTARILWSRR
ncbi:hypothetical protein [Methylobacterium sp. WL9]|uniref:hypothetical protein n=1 Tax=Methylobacterium sp. WL9 TaxID=2603898 RepID=UPI0011CCD721|nr:hypothetical protein [Methylobacterium sp. WL9]TXN24508.1 hypothetical protein FV217_03290 [Methylobacterium sp. WL9]